MTDPKQNIAQEDANVIASPFSRVTTTVQQGRRGSWRAWVLWIFLGVLVCVIGSFAGYSVLKYLNDPYRTLEPFSLDKYLADYRPLAGNKFKADLRVSADLGWKDSVGRLMVFTEKSDTRPILVLIPPKLSGTFFTKGQSYQLSVTVGEGGLVSADSCDKD
jgi:hypothetical protein